MADIKLRDRDRILLTDLVGRYRLATREVIHRKLFSAQSMDAVKSVLGRLTGGGERAYLTARPLVGKEVYYQLTTFGCRQLGFPEEWAKPLGPQALITHFAVMAWCQAEDAKRQLFLRDEWGKEFPEMKNHFHPYVLIEHAGQALLTRLKVDMGGDGARLVQTCEEFIHQASRREFLKDLVIQRLYAVAVLTSEETKAKRVRELLATAKLPVRIDVHVVPELGKVVTRTAGDEVEADGN